MLQISEKLKAYLESKGQDIDECILYLLACRHKLKYRVGEESFRFLESNKMVKLDLLTNTIIPLIGIYEDEIVDLPEIDLSVEQVIRDRVDEYRSMFKGIRTGSIGIKSKVIDLLTQFCLQHNRSFDDILMATKVYMQYTETKLISNADNFISKLDKDGNEISLLLMALEEQSFGESDSGQRTYKVI